MCMWQNGWFFLNIGLHGIFLSPDIRGFYLGYNVVSMVVYPPKLPFVNSAFSFWNELAWSIQVFVTFAKNNFLFFVDFNSAVSTATDRAYIKSNMKTFHNSYQILTHLSALANNAYFTFLREKHPNCCKNNDKTKDCYIN